MWASDTDRQETYPVGNKKGKTMRLYGKIVSSYWELNEYKKGSKKIIVSAETLITPGEGVVLFNRAKRVACVLKVTKVQRVCEWDRILRYVYVEVLNPEDQDIPVEYFGLAGFVGLHFLGYSAFCKRLKIN